MRYGDGPIRQHRNAILSGRCNPGYYFQNNGHQCHGGFLLETISAEKALSLGVKCVDKCWDCGAPVGSPHAECCDVEECTSCHGQRLVCGCEDHKSLPFNGFWPRDKVCAVLGWYSKKNPYGDGWVRCEKDDPNPGAWGVCLDISRLAVLRLSGKDGVTGKTVEELSKEYGIDIYEN